MYFYITIIIIVLVFVIYLQFDLKFEIKITKSSFSKNIAFSGVKTTLKAYWEKKVILPINLSYDGDDQFHWKLETNSLAMSVMNKEEREKYELDLMNARNRIRNKSLHEEDKTVAYTGVYKR